jgi:hypothetical protein
MAGPPPVAITIAVRKLSEVCRILKTFAIAKVISQGATEGWVNTPGVVFDIFYDRSGTGKQRPGSEGVNIPQVKDVQADILAEFKRRLHGYVDLLPQPPAARDAYLDRIVQLRGQCLSNLNYRVKGAQAVNKEVADMCAKFATQCVEVVAACAAIEAAGFFYVALGAVAGGGIVVLPLGLGPLYVAPAGATFIGGGLTAAQSVAAASGLSTICMGCLKSAQADTSGLVKVYGAHASEVFLGDTLPEARIERYEETIEGEREVIEEAEKRIDAYRWISHLLWKKSPRAASKVATALAKATGEANRAISASKVEIGLAKSKIAQLTAGASYVPLIFAAADLQESTKAVFESWDREFELDEEQSKEAGR